MLLQYPLGSPCSEDLYGLCPPSFFPSPSMNLTPSAMGDHPSGGTVGSHENHCNGGSDGCGSDGSGSGDVSGRGDGSGDVSGSGGYSGRGGHLRGLNDLGLSSLLSPRFMSPGGQGLGQGQGQGQGQGLDASLVDGMRDIHGGSSSSSGESSSAVYGIDTGCGDGDGDAAMNNYNSHRKPVSKRPLCHSWSYAGGTN